jgi:endonuclease/exonuclease/phosphatase (EEP) superfamily protein YafD
MNTTVILCLFLSLALFILSALPLTDSYHWFIRALDFPRAQLLSIELMSILLIFFVMPSSKAKVFSLILILLALAIDLYRVGPYFPFYPVESKVASLNSKGKKIKILSFNVFIANKKFFAVREMIIKEAPDVVVLLETDSEWAEAIKELKDDYSHSKFLPKDNTYGIILLSKFEIEKIDVQYLVDEKVPSIFADIVVQKQKVKLVVLHPRPPRPKEVSSLPRDGELAKAATKIKTFEKWPILVVGDLNDVAWSHTSRLFKRVAGLLDPRIGRGFFNTFHTSYPLIRIPLDHIFHNEHFEVSKLSVLEDAGSDHYPIVAEFVLKYSKVKPEGMEEASEDDMEEIRDTEQDSKEWKGPKTEDSEESEK